jgi:NAD(P) transhydrogenase subunit alpha
MRIAFLSFALCALQTIDPRLTSAAEEPTPAATSSETPATAPPLGTPAIPPPPDTSLPPSAIPQHPGNVTPVSVDEPAQALDFSSMLFVFMLATFIGLGVILRVSRLLHTPLMSLTNAISAIAVVGSIIVTGRDGPVGIRMLGAVALFASMTNIVSGFLLTDRMLKMFKSPGAGGHR